MEDMHYASAVELAKGIRSGKISALDVVNRLIERISSSSLNAYTMATPELARQSAEAIDEDISRGDERASAKPLLGVPVSLKDNIETAGVPTTYGSRVFANNIPRADAAVVTRLREAGAIIIGKTALPEFAAKPVVDSPLHGVTRNPWNTERVAGGSSGGAAAAVSAGLGPLAIGNDQAGSVRIPAALCGVVGFKPTPGRIPFAPNASPWDQLFQVGPIARTVDDVALALTALEGMHSKDPLSAPPFDGREQIADRPVRIAWSPFINFARIDPDILTVVEGALGVAGRFAEVITTDVDLSAAQDAYSLLVPFKRAIELGHHLDDWEERMDPEVVTSVRNGLSMGVDHVRAGLAARSRVYEALESVLAVHDFLATPTLSVAAFEIGRSGPATIDGQPTQSVRDWFPYTYPFNLTGHPAISVPAGWSVEGLPVGIQIVGQRHADRAVLAVARELEARMSWAETRPPGW